MITMFKIGYCGHPDFPYAHIQLDQATKLILSNFQEGDHPLFYDTLNKKKTQLVCLYIFLQAHKKPSRTDITRKAYASASTYGYGSTTFHCHMISVVVFSYSNTLQSMLVDYAVTEMVWFDDCSDAAPCSKTMMVNVITTFLLHIDQCITFNKIKLLQQHLFPRHSWSRYIQGWFSRVLRFCNIS